MQLGCLKIGNVIPRGEYAEIFQVRQTCKHLFGESHFVGQYNVGILGTFLHLIGGRTRIDRECAKLLERFP